MRMALAALLLLMSLASAARAQPFVFTAIPDENESRLRERFEKVAAYLSEQMGVEVRYIPVKSYAASITAFKNNQVQLAWFGGLSGVRARAAVPGSRALAQGAGDREFVTYFIAHTSTGLEESADFPAGIAGLTFTFGSKGSTSGRLMPEYHIRRHFGKSPREVFRRIGFSGNHTRTIALVQSGAWQVGALNYLVWEKELAAGRIDTSLVGTIWKTPTYPDYNWTIRGDVDESWGQGFSERVAAALIAMTDPELLASFPRKAFIPAENSDFDPVRDTAREIGLID